MASARESVVVCTCTYRSPAPGTGPDAALDATLDATLDAALEAALP
jgi:hypothetical protein